MTAAQSLDPGSASSTQPPVLPSPLDSVADMRTTAKWIIGATAAVGAALLGGAPLAAVGKVHGAGHAAVAFTGLSIGLFGVGWAIWHVTDALIPPLTVPSSIDTDPRLADLRALVTQDPRAFYGPFGTTIADLTKQWAFHSSVAANVGDALEREPNPHRRRALKRALAQASVTVEAIESRSRGMVELAHAWRVRADLRRARLHSFVGALLAAAGAVIFLTATSSTTGTTAAHPEVLRVMLLTHEQLFSGRFG